MVRLLAGGDTALVVEFGDAIDRDVNARVLALADRVETAGIAGVVEMVPTFRSLMVHYDPDVLLFGDLKAQVEALLPGLAAAKHAAKLWTLPTCYGGAFGPDLEHVAEATGLARDAVIELHAARTYHVYCIGFLPGWPYMGDLDERLSLPRRTSPRVKVPMGAVCIAQNMTGVYPLESPGGWHLIGRTPARMFDMRRSPSVLLSPGDQVRYVPVSRADYDALEVLADAGTLDLQPEAISA